VRRQRRINGYSRTRAIDVYRRALAQKPDSFPDLAGLGGLLTRQGKWGEALQHLARAYELRPSDDYIGHQVAVLYLQVGDEAGYRRHCLVMLDRFEMKPGEVAGPRTGLICLTSPRPVEIARATRLVADSYRRAVAAAPKAHDYGWDQFQMALAEYRNGRFTQAAELLGGMWGTSGRLGVAANILLAMSEFRLGRKGVADNRLTAAKKALRVAFGTLDGWDSVWHDWLTCDLLRREAEAMMNNTSVRPVEAVPSDPSPTGATPPSSSAKPNTGSKP
jgi:Flp pilus assembly protein TadD